MKNILGIILFVLGFNCVFANTNLNLRKLAESKGIYVGTAIMPSHLEDSKLVDLLTNNFNYLTPENHLKWENVQPAKGVFDFSGADKIVNFAIKHKMRVRGHTLAWHYQNPPWLASLKTDKEEAKKILKNHIMNVVGRYKGKIADWDVVNEPLDENGRLRVNLWNVLIGEEYIELAFRWANEADPNAKLFLNEYGVEWFGAKADAFYKLVKSLKEKGVPIHGVGFQFHIDGQYAPEPVFVAMNIKRFKELGLEVHITELDVRLRGTPSERAIEQQARIYSELMKVALAYDIPVYVTWGVTDKYSWIPSFFSGYGYALMFDDQYKPKKAAFAVSEVLAGERPKKSLYEDSDTESVIKRPLPPFRASKAKKVPIIDGEINKGEWDGTYAYSLMYNQLDTQNFNPPLSQKDIYGTWQIVYDGTKIYGLLTRVDDITVTHHKNPWDNDNFEVFYSVDGKWKQIRTIVGQNWQADNNVNGKAVWSKDGKILEFVFDIGVDVAGKTIGWNVALSDNDTPNDPLRKCQLYPIVGNNTGWQGRGFGEITFENKDGQFLDGPLAGGVMLYTTGFSSKAPILDGDDSDSQWKNAVSYPFAYNRLSKDQSLPLSVNYPGNFRLLSVDKAIYGLIKITDIDIQKLDKLEFAFAVDDNLVILTSEIGKDFAKGNWKKPAKIIWSKDKKTAEFYVEVSDSSVSGKKAGFSIGLWSKKDLKGYKPFALYPFCGYNLIIEDSAKDLGEIMSRKEIELAEIICQ